jgi:hypothetical protein
MRDKIYNILNKAYGAILFASFFAGLLPLIPFIVAIIIGGSAGEAISLFLYKEYYPWVIAAAAVAVLVGWVAMYVRKKQSPAPKKKEDEAGEDENGNGQTV